MEDLRRKINQVYLADEPEMIHKLLGLLEDYDVDKIHHHAHSLVAGIRANKGRQSLVEAFLTEYQLNSDEGIVLMCIAEALLRIPDAETQDLFLQEKLTEADWHKHHLQSDSMLVNFSTQALEITAKIEQQFKLTELDHHQVFSRLSARLGLPLIRTALKQAMQQLAYQFVIAQTIDEALNKAKQQLNYLYSFDMLGEAALTTSDADRYINAYDQAIRVLAAHIKTQDIYNSAGISIKLSALYPRYEPLQHRLAVQQISGKLLFLVKKARAANIMVTVDAEESERLEMSLDIFQQVINDPALKGWSGFGMAVQAYQKRAVDTIHWLVDLAKAKQCKIPVRLVKGAYWDYEIKQAQVNGLKNYPVFTHKTATDASYLACAKLMLLCPDTVYPQFATHNAHTIAAIQEMGRNHTGYELQRLHGMGEPLYRQFLKQQFVNGQELIACRIYAPVGNYQELLPYLVRRLLENGANTSFVNQVENSGITVESVIADPVSYLKKKTNLDSCCELPKNIFGQHRINSEGLNLADPDVLSKIQQEIEALNKQVWQAAPVVNGNVLSGIAHNVYNPANNQDLVGSVIYSDHKAIEQALSSATLASKYWRATNVRVRAGYLLKAAELLEQNRIELLSLLIREAGKTIKDALAEIREAVDFCRYYAQSSAELFELPVILPGPTGEQNHLYRAGLGVFVCISPWNFPVAIFIGQVVAALVSGNTVIAKSASQTSLLGMRCIQFLHQAGIPDNVLHFLSGDGAVIGLRVLSDNRISGVAFTGSLYTAKLINQQLTQLPGIVPFIAETGGQNVMIADNSAHFQQLIQDVVQSAFNSAGQRCSALRVLYVPCEIADKVISGVVGVMKQLIHADPQYYDTDIGPVISQSAVKQLNEYIGAMQEQGKVLFQVKLTNQYENGYFIPATLIELTSLLQLTEENFGPILHLIRYRADKLDQVIEEINFSGYGLTLGIHSRINHTINKIVENCKVGNVYINRNMISAIVGVQPFGGMRLSGTGPKAGGPHYLHRFSSEQTVTINTVAIGGNTRLLRKNFR